MLSSFGKKTITTVLLGGLLLAPAQAMATIPQVSGMNSNPLLLTRIAESEIAKVVPQTATVTIGGKTSTIHYVLVPKNSGLISDVAIAQNSVGQTDELDSLAAQNDALAAINGGYFQSFDATKPMDPYGTLIKDGRLIHKGDLSSVIGFTCDNTVKIGIMKPVITLSVGKDAIEVDQFNHTPARDGSAVAVFDKSRGKKLGFNYGANIIVSKGEVIEVAKDGDAAIPPAGFVINLTGDALKWQEILQPGVKVAMDITYVNEKGARSDWSGIESAIGAGPILIRSGNVAIDLARENFTDVKSTTMDFARSAIGVNEDGNILMVSGVNATLEQLADVMLQLGAVEAVSMDGGASSGLYANEQYVVRSSRAISNALVFRINND